jgi:hypothetical protein
MLDAFDLALTQLHLPVHGCKGYRRFQSVTIERSADLAQRRREIKRPARAWRTGL